LKGKVDGKALYAHLFKLVKETDDDKLRQDRAKDIIESYIVKN